MKRVYSREVKEAVEAIIPQSILDAMTERGWNVFGVYETVALQLKEERRRAKAKGADHAE